MVQSFLVEEAKNLIFEGDALEEWKQKCADLGLDGQLALTSEDKSPIPFDAMNEVALRVYGTLCPAKVDYRKYRRTAIPLEVLSLIHLSVNEKYFAGIEIWHDEKSPDPLAVGFLQPNGEFTNKEFFMIARWGDVLRPFEKLKELALARYTKTSKLTLQGKIADLQQRLESLEINAARYFEAENQYYDVVGF
jgi:hypothetical protein